MAYIIDPHLSQWKGNFHCHSTESDGQKSPQEVADFYAQARYDFLAITDHRKITDPQTIRTSLLLIPGVELDYLVYTPHRQAVHLIGAGVGPQLMDTPGLMDTPQQGIDGIRASGGLAIFAHPTWSLNSPETLEGLRGLSAVEVYNHVSDAPWNGRRGDSSAILDLCCCDGCCLPFVCGDDAHHYDGDQCHSGLMVSAAECTQEAILDGLAQGRVYGTQGPRFTEMKMEDGVLSFRCTPVDQVIFNSNALYSKNRVISQRGITGASYPLREMETYIRVEIADAWGRRAWSSPIKLNA